MRPGQQNRRMRGRNNNNNNNNNNRRSPNPLTRSYESNGPDVKIRGSAQQIAEKYATLARDAQSSGDRVMAENYLQHAEHYNRIIAAAQAQLAAQQVRDTRDETDEDAEDSPRESAASNGPSEHRQHYVNDGSGPQPVIEGTPAELAYNHQNGASDKPRSAANGVGNGHEQSNPGNGEDRIEAAANEESPAPRRARRPRRRTNGAQATETDAASPEQPGENGAMEQTEQS